MSQTAIFLIGFACSTVFWLSVFGWMYSRARRRVNRIKESIAQYQQAQTVVGAALDQVYSKQ
jgi:uncharacterized membrane protein YsdA (DUF1294 family)